MPLARAQMRLDVYYGLCIALGLILYFLLMRLIGLVHVVELRVFNLVIMVTGLNAAFKKFRTTDINRQFNYMRAFIFGISTSVVGSLAFAIFLFIYISFIDRQLMLSIIENEPMGRFLNPYVASFIVTVEGILSGILATFILINVKNASDIEDGMKGDKES